MSATQNSVYTHPSLVKQQLFSKYAKGEITRQELTEQIEQIQPPPRGASLSYRIATFIIVLLVAVFTPPYARRDDNS